MLTVFRDTDYGADAITGERIFPGETVLNTGIVCEVTPYYNDNLHRILKESTIVWLAEQAGYTITRSNERDPRDTTSVDSTTATNGTGTSKIGRPATRGSKAVK